MGINYGRMHPQNATYDSTKTNDPSPFSTMDSSNIYQPINSTCPATMISEIKLKAWLEDKNICHPCGNGHLIHIHAEQEAYLIYVVRGLSRPEVIEENSYYNRCSRIAGSPFIPFKYSTSVGDYTCFVFLVDPNERSVYDYLRSDNEEDLALIDRHSLFQELIHQLCSWCSYGCAQSHYQPIHSICEHTVYIHPVPSTGAYSPIRILPLHFTEQFSCRSLSASAVQDFGEENDLASVAYLSYYWNRRQHSSVDTESIQELIERCLIMIPELRPPMQVVLNALNNSNKNGDYDSGASDDDFRYDPYDDVDADDHASHPRITNKFKGVLNHFSSRKKSASSHATDATMPSSFSSGREPLFFNGFKPNRGNGDKRTPD